MAAKMGFVVALIVALSVGGSEAARTLADMQNKDYKGDSPALTHWQHALPTVSIPQTLKELISPLSSKETAETLQIIDKEKATATVTPNLFTYDAYYKDVADAKLLDSKALCEKGNLDCKPAATVTPNLSGYDSYHNDAADAKLFDSKALCEKGNLDCKPAATVTPNLSGYDSYHKDVADAKLFDGKALCEKGNLDCKPAATVTPNLSGYDSYHKNVADAKLT